MYPKVWSILVLLLLVPHPATAIPSPPPADRFELLPFFGPVPIVALAESPFPERRIYALTHEGSLLVSDDSEVGWSVLPPSLPTFSNAKILPDPQQADELFVVLDSQVFFSPDGGATFSLLALPSGAGDLWLDSDRERRFTAEGSRLAKWTPDQDWQFLTPVLPGDTTAGIRDLALDPAAPNRLLAAVGSYWLDAEGIFESRDEGLTWTRKLASIGVSRVLYDPFRPARIWAFASGGGGATLWRSDDDGESWIDTRAPIGETLYSLVLDPSRPDQVAVLGAQRHVADDVFVHSSDAGQSWESVATPLARGNRALLALEDGRWLLGFAGDSIAFYGLLESEDEGSTWQVNDLPGQAIWVTLDPKNIQRAWVVDRSGVHLTEDGGMTWRLIFYSNEPIRSAQLAVDAQEETVLYLALSRFQGGGYLWRSDDRGERWWQIASSESFVGVQDLRTGVAGGKSFVLARFEGVAPGLVWRSLDRGETWDNFVLAKNGPLAIEAERGYVYLASGSELLFSTDYGTTFAPNLDLSPLTAYSTRLEAGRPVTQYWLVTDRQNPGEAHLFSNQFPQGLEELPMPNGNSPAVDVLLPGPLRDQVFFAGRDSEGQAHLWRSLRHGLDWTAIDRGLPEKGIGALACWIDGDTLWATGRDVGVYRGRFSTAPPLSLQHHRFEIQVTWDPHARQGRAQAQFLSEEAGYFWFFSPDNVELAVKILDGRAINHSWWFFVASLTDVEYDLQVRDLASGEVRNFHNPAGGQATFGDITAWQDPPAFKEAPAATPPATSLHDRFDLEVEWRDFLGNTGFGLPVSLTEDAVGFYFFSPGNVELIVKLLDARRYFGHFWLFTGSLTDVEYSLRIRDRETGKVLEVINPLGTFASYKDLEAF